MTLGICRNPACPAGAAGTLLERYPGPGEYCPDCGGRLEPAAAEAPPLPSPSSPPQPPPPLPPLPRRRKGKRVPAVIGLTLAAAAFLFFHALLTGPSAPVVHVCRSSMSQRFAGDVIAAFLATPAGHGLSVDLMERGACDVRFSVWDGSAPNGPGVVARDGIVPIVQTVNPLSRLSEEQLRKILRGEITDWSQVGAGSGPIQVVIPDERTDEGQVVAKELLGRSQPGRNVSRARSSAEVVTSVAGDHGRGEVGLAALSASIAAKVVQLGSNPPPSAIAIRERRYPFAVTLVVEAAGASPPKAAVDLIRFALSGKAQTLATKEGLITASDR